MRADGLTWHPFSLEEMIPSMDGWESLVPDDMNDQGIIIGESWFTDPTNPAAERERHGFMLVQLGFHPREDGINKGFDPRTSADDPWPWASVAKGGPSNVVKLVLPDNAAQMQLVVVADGSGSPEVDVTPRLELPLMTSRRHPIHFIRSNLDFTAASGWLQRLVKSFASEGFDFTEGGIH